MSAITTEPSSPPATRVHRIEVHPRPNEPDPHAHQLADEVRRAFGGEATMRTARVYLIEAVLSDEQVERVAMELLADPVNQQAVIGASPSLEERGGEGEGEAIPAAGATVEVHYLPGVMDPVAQSTRDAIGEMFTGGEAPEAVEVRTGFRYDVKGPGVSAEALHAFAERSLANTVVQQIHDGPYAPPSFVHAGEYRFSLTHVPIRELDDDGLRRLSRQGHLFLSLDEMRAAQSYYIEQQREPTDIELETLAQTWSEHCVHKTLKATVRYAGPDAERWAANAGHERNDDGSVTIHNLLKQTIAAATHELMARPPHSDWCISVFADNAGVVRFDDEDAVCIKVETHNHPSAIEPYGGAATGIGGCIRDIMGTGLAARPVANTDVFCVAFGGEERAEGRERAEGQGPRAEGQGMSDGAEQESLGPWPLALGPSEIPKGVIPPRRILQRVVAGVRDYGNRMGIPTVNGAVCFDDGYLANPLVYCGCIGIMPLDKCFGEARPGDRIIALGGATGRDGIHGATFSSAELTDTHADEFAHAVQIGNAITQKKTLDVILQARGEQGEAPLFSAITDCGAGGFSSAVGEMGEKVGAYVTLESAPLKYAGLSYTEIWISEAQERMVLAVPPEHVEALRELCEAEDVPMCELGRFGETDAQGQPQLVLTYHGEEVGRLSMGFLHDGLPMPVREGRWEGTKGPRDRGTKGGGIGASTQSLSPSVSQSLLRLLSHPNIASKHWIIRQYDHEVQGGSVVKPLVGPGQDGPSDAAVIRPKLGSDRAVAIGCGMAPNLSEKATADGYANDGDSYFAALAAIDEAVRNVVCVGADPRHIAILDNFCWPSCDTPAAMGSLVRAAQACREGALAYRTPFISGKDSLNNQFTTEDGRLIAIPPTLLITALGIVPDALRCRTMDAKRPGDLLFVIGLTTGRMGGSHLAMLHNAGGSAGASASHADLDLSIPRVDLSAGPANAAAVAALIDRGLVAAAHDCSDGGLLVAAAEMAFAGRVGLDLDLEALPTDRPLDPSAACFAETPSRYLVEVAPAKVDPLMRLLRDAGVPFGQVGAFAEHDRLTVRTPRDGRIVDESLEDLRRAWLAPLDW